MYAIKSVLKLVNALVEIIFCVWVCVAVRIITTYSHKKLGDVFEEVFEVMYSMLCPKFETAPIAWTIFVKLV